MTGDFKLMSASALKFVTALKVEKLLRDQTAEIERLLAESRRDADEITLLRFENEKLSELVCQLSEKVVRLKVALGEPRHEK